MNPTDARLIVSLDEPILVTGAGGFIGSRVVVWLTRRGFKNVRAFVRDAARLTRALGAACQGSDGSFQVLEGNLLSRDDCERATEDVSVIYHLAAGIEKSFAGAFLNSVVTTRNLLDAAVASGALRRFVNVSSLGVYSNRRIPRGGLLDETCDVETCPVERGEAYLYGKIKQDEIVREYAGRYGSSYVILRPGVVFGPGKKAITGRVGIDTFGVFLHLGGSNRIPFTYVDNCAEAIALAGLREGVDGEVFNVVDDHLPKSRDFLREYKKRVGRFPSLPVPYHVFYVFCRAWEAYSRWSDGQLPPVFNRHRCAADWKGNQYCNRKLKELLGWQPRIPMDVALDRYFAFMRS
ncbi:MAG: NAD(P)-dependent oxidoreductase [candidate division WOR-3 bacterium]